MCVRVHVCVHVHVCVYWDGWGVGGEPHSFVTLIQIDATVQIDQTAVMWVGLSQSSFHLYMHMCMYYGYNISLGPFLGFHS